MAGGQCHGGIPGYRIQAWPTIGGCQLSSAWIRVFHWQKWAPRVLSQLFLGALMASIKPARSVISSLRGPTTSVVFVLLEYPAMSIAARILPRASPSRASRKSSCLGVRVFVIEMSYCLVIEPLGLYRQCQECTGIIQRSEQCSQQE